MAKRNSFNESIKLSLPYRHDNIALVSRVTLSIRKDPISCNVNGAVLQDVVLNGGILNNVFALELRWKQTNWWNWSEDRGEKNSQKISFVYCWKYFFLFPSPETIHSRYLLTKVNVCSMFLKTSSILEKYDFFLMISHEWMVSSYAQLTQMIFDETNRRWLRSDFYQLYPLPYDYRQLPRFLRKTITNTRSLAKLFLLNSFMLNFERQNFFVPVTDLIHLFLARASFSKSILIRFTLAISISHWQSCTYNIDERKMNETQNKKNNLNGFSLKLWASLFHATRGVFNVNWNCFDQNRIEE